MRCKNCAFGNDSWKSECFLVSEENIWENTDGYGCKYTHKQLEKKEIKSREEMGEWMIQD